jgi:hypothetical protein
MASALPGDSGAFPHSPSRLRSLPDRACRIFYGEFRVGDDLVDKGRPTGHDLVPRNEDGLSLREDERSVSLVHAGVVADRRVSRPSVSSSTAQANPFAGQPRGGLRPARRGSFARIRGPETPSSQQFPATTMLTILSGMVMTLTDFLSLQEHRDPAVIHGEPFEFLGGVPGGFDPSPAPCR